MLLSMQGSSSRITPLPKLQICILLYLQAAEPITAFVIFPFINQLIFEYGISDGDEQKVGYYAGSVNTLFFLAEMISVYHWGRLSDRIGRRPVLMMGVVGLIFSSVLFGISKTFIGLVFSRALSGALNGNIGVSKSMIAEITDETNQAKAFGFIGLAFLGGMTVASFMGGVLTHPYERFPSIFGHWQFWKSYPYALPCFVSAIFCLSALLITFFFLKESLHTPKNKPAGEGYVTSLPQNSVEAPGETPPTATTSLLPKPELLPLREVLTPGVRIAIINYGTYSLVSGLYLSVQPLFLSTPIGLGGIGLPTPIIGLFLGGTGLLGGLLQAICFAPLQRRVPLRTLYMIGLASFYGTYLSWPLMVFFTTRSGKVDAATISLLALQQVCTAIAALGFGCTHIFVASAAPTRNTLGATTGLAQTLVSFTRAVGPAAAAYLYAYSLDKNVLGGQLLYVVLFVLISLALLVATWLPKVVKRASDVNTHSE
ncbi:MFS general substrate transporter [Ramaria rubella]|nr:MFS general substrate transporter [Ramaria rubella]